MKLGPFVTRLRQSPELLPTFRLGLLGVSLVLAVFECTVGHGVTARALAPLLFGLVALLPVPAALWGGGTAAGALLAFGMATPSEQGVLAALLLGGAVMVGRSLAVLPLRWSIQGGGTVSQGAILLIWHRRANFHVHLRGFMEQQLDELRTLLRFTDSTLRYERLQARYGAILEMVPQGVVFVEAHGQQGWVNPVAGEMLGLAPGPVEPVVLARAMSGLRSRAINPGRIPIKGKGEMDTWLLEGRKN